MPPTITRQFPKEHLVRCRVWFPRDEGDGHTSIQVDGPVPATVADAFAAISIHIGRLKADDFEILQGLTKRLKKRAAGGR